MWAIEYRTRVGWEVFRIVDTFHGIRDVVEECRRYYPGFRTRITKVNAQD